MKTTKLSVSLFCISMCTVAHASIPVYPGAVVGRELNAPNLGRIGHVGLVTGANIGEEASQVIEVLFEVPVIQINTLENFKSRTAYWGSKYGIAGPNENTLRMLREANFQKDLGCTTFTVTSNYEPSTGSYIGNKAQPTHCGIFRCDTFINYIYHYGNYTLPTYNPPGYSDKPTTPKLLFSAFPYGNEDGHPMLLQYISPIIYSENKNNTSINTVTAETLETISDSEFINIVDVPNRSINSSGAAHILQLAKDPTLSIEKRTFLMDKFGFVGSKEALTELVSLYDILDEKESALKKQLIATTQNLYQRHLSSEKTSNEKAQLQQFYLKLLQTNLAATEKAIVTRGFISLSPSNTIINNLPKINVALNDRALQSYPTVVLGLKTELINKSRELENIYIPEVVDTLSVANKSDLNDKFNAFIVERLRHLGVHSLNQDSRIRIARYLEKIQPKQPQRNLMMGTARNINLFSDGTWLEATALIHSNSTQDAGRYIADYLHTKKSNEQRKYIMGLSNASYLQKAFRSEAALISIKKENKTLYDNTIGIRP